MDIAKYKDKQRYAGEKIPSMTRRRLGHDYEARRMYLITITVEELTITYNPEGGDGT